MTYPDQTPARLIEIALSEVGYVEEGAAQKAAAKQAIAECLELTTEELSILLS